MTNQQRRMAGQLFLFTQPLLIGFLVPAADPFIFGWTRVLELGEKSAGYIKCIDQGGGPAQFSPVQ
jgi:hypothetical protein